jgi:hypothetical protein
VEFVPLKKKKIKKNRERDDESADGKIKRQRQYHANSGEDEED